MTYRKHMTPQQKMARARRRRRKARGFQDVSPERMAEIRESQAKIQQGERVRAMMNDKGPVAIRQLSQRLRPSHTLGRRNLITLPDPLAPGGKRELDFKRDILLNNRQDHTRAERELRRKEYADAQ